MLLVCYVRATHRSRPIICFIRRCKYDSFLAVLYTTIPAMAFPVTDDPVHDRCIVRLCIKLLMCKTVLEREREEEARKAKSIGQRRNGCIKRQTLHSVITVRTGDVNPGETNNKYEWGVGKRHRSPKSLLEDCVGYAQ